jgi:dienelactone hydrolase
VTEGTSISAAAIVHPSFLDPAVDAPKVTVPFAVLPSKNEDAANMKSFYDALTVPKYFETFSESVHGWMAARADLSKEDDRKYFRKGYETVLNFFTEHVKP